MSTSSLPDIIYVERDSETNEKRWYSVKGMGEPYTRLASTPKAGVDREVIARLASEIAQRADGFDARGMSIFSGNILAEELRDICHSINAILALPSVLGGVDQPSIADGLQCNEQSGKQLSLATDPELLALIERAKSHVMTPAERYEQRRSFVRGICPSNRDYAEWCAQVDKIIPPIPQTDTLPPDNAGLVSGGGR